MPKALEQLAVPTWWSRVSLIACTAWAPCLARQTSCFKLSVPPPARSRDRTDIRGLRARGSSAINFIHLNTSVGSNKPSGMSQGTLGRRISERIDTPWPAPVGWSDFSLGA